MEYRKRALMPAMIYWDGSGGLFDGILVIHPPRHEGICNPIQLFSKATLFR
jgi:hypothetical protein